MHRMYLKHLYRILVKSLNFSTINEEACIYKVSIARRTLIYGYWLSMWKELLFRVVLNPVNPQGQSELTLL